MKINGVTTNIYNNYCPKNKPQRASIPNIVYKAKPKLKFAEINDFSPLSDIDKLRNMVTLAKNESPIFIKQNVKNKLSEYFNKVKTYIGINKNSIDFEKLQNEYKIIGEAEFIQQNSTFFAKLIDSENENRPGYDVFYNNIFNSQIPSINRQLISKKIGESNENLFYECGLHNGALNFIHKNIVFFEDIIGIQKTSNNNLPVEKENKEMEAQELLKKFCELENEISEAPKPVTAEEKEMYKAKFQLRQKYYREIKEKNISMVEDPNFSTDPTIDIEAKKQYLNRIKFLSVVNESSQKDCLNMYEKYGFRYWIDENCDRSFIRDLSLIATPSEFSDGEYLMNRFLDIAEKTTEHDPLGMRDGNKVMLMYEMHGCNYSEELTLRFINLMKKLSFQQLDATVFEIRTAGKRTPAISKAIEELKQITKDFPEVDRFKNT